MDFALQSCADYRIYLSHYPSSYDLAERIAKRKPGEQCDEDDDEQLVSVVVDNVTGRHYGRQPRWLGVHEADPPQPKRLFCGRWADYVRWRESR